MQYVSTDPRLLDSTGKGTPDRSPRLITQDDVCAPEYTETPDPKYKVGDLVWYKDATIGDGKAYRLYRCITADTFGVWASANWVCIGPYTCVPLGAMLYWSALQPTPPDGFEWADGSVAGTAELRTWCGSLFTSSATPVPGTKPIASNMIIKNTSL
jgi:hypothetical protein